MSPFVIKKMRKKFRLTQVDLAMYTGVHPMTVSKWERGELNPGGAPLILLRAIWKYQENALSIIKNLRWNNDKKGACK